MFFKTKVTPCPNCNKKLRFPIKKGKTLRITCPNCSRQFDVTFYNPFAEVFSWKQKIGILDNFKLFRKNYQKLPKKEKRQMIIFFIMFVIFLIFLGLSIFIEFSLDKKEADIPKSSKEISI